MTSEFDKLKRGYIEGKLKQFAVANPTAAFATAMTFNATEEIDRYFDVFPEVAVKVDLPPMIPRNNAGDVKGALAENAREHFAKMFQDFANKNNVDMGDPEQVQNAMTTFQRINPDAYDYAANLEPGEGDADIEAGVQEIT